MKTPPTYSLPVKDIVDIEDARFLAHLDELISIAQAQDDKKDIALMELAITQAKKD